jgi:hypothetical protein
MWPCRRWGVVGVMTRLRATRSGFGSRQGERFSVLQNIYTGNGAQPVPYSKGTDGSLPGLERPELEAQLNSLQCRNEE